MKILKFLGVLLVILTITAIVLLGEGDIPKDVVDARYLSPASQFLDLRQAGRIHYRDEGSRRAPAVVLIHGSNASLHTFEPWVRLLAGEYRIITIDMPGHGLTGAVPSNDYSADAMLAVISAVLDQLSVTRFVIGGNSMGGGLAWRYALQHMEEVRGLVLINSTGARPPAEGDDESAIRGFEVIRAPWFGPIAARLDPYYLVAQGLRVAYNYSSLVDQALIMRYNDMLLREGSRAATVQRFRQAYDKSAEGAAPTPDFSRLTMPTLIMWGMEDAVIPFAYASTFESTIPNVTTAYYEQVGHIPMEENPDESARDLKRFLDSLVRPDRSAREYQD